MMLKRTALVALALSVAGGGLLLQSATQAERVRAMDQALQDAAAQIKKGNLARDISVFEKPDGTKLTQYDYWSNEQARLAVNPDIETLRFGPGRTGRMTLLPSPSIRVEHIQRLELSLQESLRLLRGGQIERRVKEQRRPDGSKESLVESESEARERTLSNLEYGNFDPFGRRRVLPGELAIHPGTGNASPAAVGTLDIEGPWHWTLWAEYPPETLASASVAQLATLIRHPVPAMIFVLLCAGLMYAALRPARNQRSTHGDIDLLSHAGQAAPADALGRLLSLDRENAVLRRQMLDQAEQLKQVTEGVIQRRASRQHPATDSSPA